MNNDDLHIYSSTSLQYSITERWWLITEILQFPSGGDCYCDDAISVPQKRKFKQWTVWIWTVLAEENWKTLFGHRAPPQLHGNLWQGVWPTTFWWPFWEDWLISHSYPPLELGWPNKWAAVFLENKSSDHRTLVFGGSCSIRVLMDNAYSIAVGIIRLSMCKVLSFCVRRKDFSFRWDMLPVLEKHLV